jgi:hypothetical protein
MKKIIYLLSVTFLILQSCSTGNSNSSNNTLLMRKWYDNSYHCSNGNRDYYEFSAPNIFRHYITLSNLDCNYILPEYGTWTKNGEVYVITADEGDARVDDGDIQRLSSAFSTYGFATGFSVSTSNNDYGRLNILRDQSLNRQEILPLLRLLISRRGIRVDAPNCL